MKDLLDLTGFGFKAIIGLAVPDLMKKEYLEGTEGCSLSARPYKYIPDNVARAYLKTVNNTAELCRANEELHSAFTDVVLCAASILALPSIAVGAVGRIGAAIYSIALGSGELARDVIKFRKEDAESEFAAGSFAVIGVERYTVARLKTTPGGASNIRDCSVKLQIW